MRSSIFEELIIKNNEELFIDLFRSYRWGKMVYCPYCGSVHIYRGKGRYKCADCNGRFTDKTNTLFHASKLPIYKWFQGFYLLMGNNGISSVSLSKALKVTQKTAWFMLQKLRYALNTNDVLLNGMVAQDEMYVGGSWSNKHYGKKLLHLRNFDIIDEDETDYTKEELYQGVSLTKHPVFGMTDDSGKVVLQAVPNPCESLNLTKVLKQHNGNIKYCVSDESHLYNYWELPIIKMNHGKNKYKNRGVSSNAIEGVFSHFKRHNVSTYVHQTEQYLQLYLNEFCFRWNFRKNNFDEICIVAFKKFSCVQVSMGDIRNYNPFIDFNTRPRPREIFEQEISRMKKCGSMVTSCKVKNKVLRKGKDW